MTATSAQPAAPARPARRSPLAQLTRVELTLFLRERVGPIWGVGFPVLLLVIFGAIPAFRKVLPGSGGLTVLDSYLPILVVISLALLCLISLPLTIVNYRERGVLRRLRTTPAGPLRVLGAQLIVNFGMAIVTLVVLEVVARLAYGVAFPAQLGGWAVTVLFASAALLGMGLFVAAVGPTARASAAIGNLVFYPMMFFGGLWLPIPQMPTLLQHIAHATPLGAAWEAFQQSDLGHWPPPLALITMAAWAVAFGAGAVRFFRWE
ncbi:MAG TPA: ABC transporter permease [Trebonia sp.]|nr:ABC transporter permease [Trebonia sp.]